MNIRKKEKREKFLTVIMMSKKKKFDGFTEINWKLVAVAAAAVAVAAVAVKTCWKYQDKKHSYS